MVHPLKNILNKLRWDSRENPENYLITYRHRGAPDDMKKILASQIIKLGKSYFVLSEDSDETTIPFHRILQIRNLKDETVVWRKRYL
jgi:uncharacterized protein (UPF0248 family)